MHHHSINIRVNLCLVIIAIFKELTKSVQKNWTESYLDAIGCPPIRPKNTPEPIRNWAAKRDKIKRLIQHHANKHQQQDLLDGETDVEATLQSKRHQQAIGTLNKATDKIDAFLKNSEPRRGKGKRIIEVKSNITDNESAKMTTSKRLYL